jgi:hypothetical protein
MLLSTLKDQLMRTEDFVKAKEIVYVIGSAVRKFEPFDSEDPEEVEKILKQQMLQAEKEIRGLQVETQYRHNGYIIKGSTVYQVVYGNSLVMRITGDRAKEVRRKVR